MEVLQGSVLQSSATLVDARHGRKQHHGSSVYASLSLKPHSFPAVSSWGRGNALAAKIPLVGTRGRKSSRPVIVMESLITNKIYAEAMLHLGKTNNILDDLYKDMKNIGKYFDDEEAMTFFKSASITPDEKKEVIESFEEVYKISEYTKNLLLMMNEKYKLPDMKEIIDDFEEMYFKENGTVSGVVTSFKELDAAELEEIAKQVQEKSNAKSVVLKTKVDASVLGGWKVFWESSIIDNTVRGRLDDIVDIMKANPMEPGELQPLPLAPKIPEEVNVEAKIDNTISLFRERMEKYEKEADEVAEVAAEVAKKALYDNAKPLDALAALERETAKVRSGWEARLEKQAAAYVANSEKNLNEAKAFLEEREKEYEEGIKKLSLPPPEGYEMPEATGVDGGVREPVPVGVSDSEAA